MSRRGYPGQTGGDGLGVAVLALLLVAGAAGPAAACPSCRLGQRVRASVLETGLATHVAAVVVPPLTIAGAALWLRGRGGGRPRGGG